MRRAFTLIELLVVISIIALLIAILLPMLSSAKRSAVRMQCGSNIRQVGTALHIRANERKGYFPLTYRYIKNDTQLANLTRYSDFPSSPGKNDGIRWMSRATYDELVDTGITLETFTCPNREGESKFFLSGNYAKAGYYIQAGRYMAAGHFAHGNKLWQPPMSIEDPSDWVMLSDIDEYNKNNGSSFSHSPSGLIERPGLVTPQEAGSDGGNNMFTDGSVQWVRPEGAEVFASTSAASSGNVSYWYDSPGYEQP